MRSTLESSHSAVDTCQSNSINGLSRIQSQANTIYLVYSKLNVRHSSTSTEISAMDALGTLVPFSPISPTSDRRTTTKRPFRLPPLPLTLSRPVSLPLSVLPSQNSPPVTTSQASDFPAPCSQSLATHHTLASLSLPESTGVCRQPAIAHEYHLSLLLCCNVEPCRSRL